MTVTIVLLVALALVFDFLNGFHDSANSVATVVSTRVLSPRYAVLWAAFFNFVAFLFFGLHVANTIGKGIIDITIVDNSVIFGTLVGACAWDIFTWYFGLPTSSSHALMGGMIGAALVKAGTGVAGVGRHPQDGRLHLRLADHRPRARVPDGRHRLPAGRPKRPVESGPRLSKRAVGFRRAVQPGPRRKRRAENHGHHRQPSVQRGAAGRHVSHSRCGSCSPATRPSPWERCSAAGAW